MNGSGYHKTGCPNSNQVVFGGCSGCLYATHATKPLNNDCYAVGCKGCSSASQDEAKPLNTVTFVEEKEVSDKKVALIVDLQDAYQRLLASMQADFDKVVEGIRCGTLGTYLIPVALERNVTKIVETRLVASGQTATARVYVPKATPK